MNKTTTINCTKNEGSKEQIMKKENLNELIQENPTVKRERNKYENVENHILDIIRKLEDGSGLSDDVFVEINNCISEIRTIDQEVRNAEIVAMEKIFREI